MKMTHYLISLKGESICLVFIRMIPLKGDLQAKKNQRLPCGLRGEIDHIGPLCKACLQTSLSPSLYFSRSLPLLHCLSVSILSLSLPLTVSLPASHPTPSTHADKDKVSSSPCSPNRDMAVRSDPSITRGTELKSLVTSRGKGKSRTEG